MLIVICIEKCSTLGLFVIHVPGKEAKISSCSQFFLRCVQCLLILL